MKGSLSGPLAMLGVFLLATVLFVQSVPISKAFSNEALENLNGLGRITETKSRAHLFFYNYLPTAAEHSVNQMSYELGKKGGGEPIKWSSEDFKTSSTIPLIGISPSCSSYDLLRRIECRLEKNSTRHLQNKYINNLGGGNCQRLNANYTVSVLQKKFLQIIIADKYYTESLALKCGNPSTLFNTTDTSFATLRAEGNRYTNLTYIANRTLDSLYTEWTKVNEYRFQEGNPVCGSLSNSDYQKVESNIVGNYSNSITSKETTALNSHPKFPSFKIIESTIAMTKQTLNYGTNTSIFNVSSQSSGSDVGSCCNYDECNLSVGGGDETGPACGCDKKSRNATVNISVAATNYTLAIKDTKYEVLTSSGWRNLIFKVDPYTHWFQKDE